MNKGQYSVVVFVALLFSALGLLVSGFLYIQFKSINSELNIRNTELKEMNDKIFSLNVYLEEQRNSMQQEIDKIKSVNSDEIKKIAGAVLYSYDDFDKKSKAMVAWIVDAESRMKSMVSVHDKNVEVYNKHMAQINYQIQDLRNEVAKHREIFLALSRGRW